MYDSMFLKSLLFLCISYSNCKLFDWRKKMLFRVSVWLKRCLNFVWFVWFLIVKTENIHYSGAYAALGIDNSLRLDEFRKNFKVKVTKLNEDDMEFDLIGIDASIANAFRRILISEVYFCYVVCFHCVFLKARSKQNIQVRTMYLYLKSYKLNQLKCLHWQSIIWNLLNI